MINIYVYIFLCDSWPVLYRVDEQVLSWYVRRDLTGHFTPPKLPQPGVLWEAKSLSYTETVYLDGNPVGALYLEDDLDDLHRRILHFTKALAVMAGTCLLIVYVLSAWLPNGITRPIYDLAWTARCVASRKDYSLRAPLSGGAELGQLSTDFNYMLQEIERQNTALAEARDRSRGHRDWDRRRETGFDLRTLHSGGCFHDAEIWRNRAWTDHLNALGEHDGRKNLGDQRGRPGKRVSLHDAAAGGRSQGD